MATTFLNDVTVAIGSYDLTTRTNAVSISSEPEQLESTTFRSGGARTYVAGLYDSTVEVSGYWEAGGDGATPTQYYPDDLLFSNLSNSDVATSIAVAQDAGSVAYFTKSQQISYALLGQVGELAPFSAQAKGTHKVVRGITLNDPTTILTASGSATGQEYVAASSGQTIYAALHVFAVSGTSTPTLTVKLQSDVDVNFASATDVITFTAATAVTSEWKSAAGPNTDTFYRLNYTISGTNPKFQCLLVVGIA